MAFLLTVLAGGTIGYLMVPERASAPAASGAAPTVAPSPAVATLERGENGHFVGIAEVNGHAIRVVVDTGATTVALTPEDARSAGLAVDRARWRPIGRTASGEAIGEALELGKVSLDGVERMDVQAVVLDGLPVSLLGQSFLRRLEAVEIHGDRMTLR